MVKIRFFFMPLCPRSYFSLKNCKREIDGLEGVYIDVKKVFFIRRKSALYFPPVIEIENRILSGFYLSSKKIKKFIGDYL
ncbi:MAG: hypothetical protein CSB21_02610 [Deltaproteobacteria bacterium]|nr:MAG: hypothetical protein CSB21_02610 [Deltaproteobacteria bacterium]